MTRRPHHLAPDRGDRAAAALDARLRLRSFQPRAAAATSAVLGRPVLTSPESAVVKPKCAMTRSPGSRRRLCREPLQQSSGGGRRAQFGAVDEIDEYIKPAPDPFPGPLGPEVERRIGIAGRFVLDRPAQPRIDKIRGDRVNRRVFVVVDQRDSDIASAQQLGKSRIEKAWVPHFDDMPQDALIDCRWQQGQNASKSLLAKRRNGGNCHNIGPSLCCNSSTPLARKRSIAGPADANSRRWVAKRGALTENTKSAGVSSCHRRKLPGF